MIIRENITDFHTQQIFDCGQCFRWTRCDDGSYAGIAFGKPVNIRFVPYDKNEVYGKLIIDNISEEEFERIWKCYLNLDRDYGAVKKRLTEKDPIMAEAVKSGQGIRILRQDPWETIVSFLISQNNNIPRIKKCIEGLCENFGESAGIYGGREWFSFPGAEQLSILSEGDLAPIKLGYRAKYIIETAKKVQADGIDLETLRDQKTEDVYEYLTGLCGVGPKVANCILLFGMGKFETFPIDVLMKRVMNRLYGLDENDMKAMARFAEERFGEYGGIAQQYLFYHIRQSEM